MWLCDASDEDLEAVLRLNNAAVPNVNALEADELDALAAMGSLRVVRGALPPSATLDDPATTIAARAERPAASAAPEVVAAAEPIGAILTLPEGRPYASLNYRWFCDRFETFLYIDRVVVSEAARGTGVGSLIYEDAIARAAAAGAARVCSEVNVDPPNPKSLRFHLRHGFTILAERRNEAHGKTVAMMVRELA